MDIVLLPGLSGPLYRQVFETLRRAISEGALAPGQKLQATRELARSLVVSRNTVNAAYDMLQAEGYVVARQGAGYFVTDVVPEQLETGAGRPRVAWYGDPARQTSRGLSQRGEVLARASRPVSRLDNPAFQRGLPALDHFPVKAWQQHIDRYCRDPGSSLMRYQDEGGHRKLKEALTEYLTLARGVRCDPSHVIIVSGGQAALDLVTRMLVDIDETVAIEDPGYLGARDALESAGARLAPVPADQDGIDVERLSQTDAHLVYVTPSYQFPSGVTMSAARRMALLHWASERDAFVIEDDYDSEFRYGGRPLTCLQGIDTEQRVIYVGTFSKVMFPALRLGYVVAPPQLATALQSALRKTGQDAPMLLQAAMADFIRSGQFGSHIRRMRALYGRRQQLFVRLAHKHLGGLLSVSATDAGMQLATYFQCPIDKRVLRAEAAAVGIDVVALSEYYLGECPRDGLFLGYSGIPETEMEKNILRLRQALEASVPQAPRSSASIRSESGG